MAIVAPLIWLLCMIFIWKQICEPLMKGCSMFPMFRHRDLIEERKKVVDNKEETKYSSETEKIRNN